MRAEVVTSSCLWLSLTSESGFSSNLIQRRLLRRPYPSPFIQLNKHETTTNVAAMVSRCALGLEC